MKVSIIKKVLFAICISAVVFFGFILRIDRFSNYPSYQWQAHDYSRDYIAAHHIAHYGEQPLTGPDGKFGTTRSSPLYFYFLASVLLIHDSPIFLAYTNVFLQIFTLIFLYILAKEMFGRETGLAATSLFAVSRNIIEQSASLWQPHVMQPFLLLSYLLFWWSYSKKNYILLLFSVVTLSFSSALHLSSLGIMPIYAAIVVLIAKRQQMNLSRSVGLAVAFFGSFLLAYLPTIFYAWKIQASENELLAPITGAFSHQSPEALIVGISSRFRDFFEFFFVGIPAWPLFLPLLIGVLVIMGTLYFKNAGHSQKSYMVILTAAIVQFFFVIIFLNQPGDRSFPIHYFTPVFTLFIIFLAEVLNIARIKSLWMRGGKMIAIALLIWVVSPGLIQRTNNAWSHIQERGLIGFFVVPDDADPRVEAMVNKIQEIRLTEQKKGFSFFQIKPYTGSLDNDYLYMALEYMLDEKLVALDDTAWRDYSPLGTDDYIFAVCPFSQQLPERGSIDCSKKFLTEHQNHIWMHAVYSGHPYSIYLAKKANE